MTLKLWLEHLGLQLPPASTLGENLNAVSNQTRRLIHADVRQDPLIGPIFNAQIKDWKEHLEIVTSFGKHSRGGPRTYARPMPMKHLPLHLKEERRQR
jgi:truncated hemoglobin YjbI